MLNMDLKRAKILKLKNLSKIAFSQFTLALERYTPRPSSQSLF